MVQLATGSEMEGGGEGEQETSRAQGSDRTARVLVVPSAARSMVVYGVHTRTIGPYSNPEVYCGHGVQSRILYPGQGLRTWKQSNG